METKQTRIGGFFATISTLIMQGKLKRGKDYKISEWSNGKVLFLHLESIYPLYKDADPKSTLLLSDLNKGLSCSSAFVKYAKTVEFKWSEILVNEVPVNYKKTICCMALCYDTLKEIYRIDFERYNIEEFETALLKRKVEIDELSLKGKFVSKAIGFIQGQKHIWNADGSCFTKSGNPNPKYNLKFE